MKIQLSVPNHRLHEYQEQRESLEFTIQATDGVVKFSRYISESSGYFNIVCQKRENFEEGPIHYDGTKGSLPFTVGTIKVYWDLAHGLHSNMSLFTKLDLIRFILYEGKFELGGFEGQLLVLLTDSLGNLENDAKLMICFVLSTFQNTKAKFEENFAKATAFDYIKDLAWSWDSKKEANMEIVRYYAHVMNLELEEAAEELSNKILIYVKNVLSKHYFDTEDTSLLESKYRIETQQQRALITVDTYTVTIGNSKYKDRNGVFVKVTALYDRCVYKRVDGEDMYIYCNLHSNSRYWTVGPNLNSKVFNNNPFVKSEALTPPEKGWSCNALVTKTKSKALLMV